MLDLESTIDKRLRKRYQNLVTHFSKTSQLTNSMNTPFDENKTHSHTQALWRFLHNDKIKVEDLNKPLMTHANDFIKYHCHEVVLMAHDWSRISLNHTNKTDRLTMTHQTDVGYELQSSLLISDSTGSPLCPLVHNLVTQEKVLSTYNPTLTKVTHLEELTQRMQWLSEQWQEKTMLHIIDREADVAGYLRQWNDENLKFLVRTKVVNKLTYQGKSLKTKEIIEKLTYQKTKNIDYKGQQAILKIAETPVVLSRIGKSKNKKRAEQLKNMNQAPIDLRLICTRVEDLNGKLLSIWCLLTNSEYSKEKIANYYYYRWQIESYFKLLKSAGHQMEHWLQESGEAFFKRLLIVAHSCVMVWELIHDKSPQAEQTRIFLVRLSGRQMKRNKPITATAILDGYMKLLSAYEIMKQIPIEQVEQMIQKFQGHVV